MGLEVAVAGKIAEELVIGARALAPEAVEAGMQWGKAALQEVFGPKSVDTIARSGKLLSSALDNTSVWNSVHSGPAISMLTGAKEPLIHFAKELAPGIRQSRWTNIIADDVSGRIPGKIAWDMMKLHASDNGLSAPKLFFVAASFERDMTPMLSELAAHNKQLQNGRSLFVTEYIHGGRTVNQVSSIFQKHGIPFDVAAVAAKDKHSLILPTLGLPPESSLLFTDAQIAREHWWLYSKASPDYRRAIGVEKESNSAVSRTNLNDTAAIRELRLKMKEISEELYQSVVKS